MKKLCALLFILMFIFIPNVAYADSEGSTYIVTANYAYIYQSFNQSSEKLKKVENKTEINIEFENGGPKQYTDGIDIFYKVLQYDEIDGFIYAELVTPKTKAIVSIPNFNAETNKDSIVYQKLDNEIVETSITLKKNERIFLYEGFKNKSDYTAIAYLYENEVYYGYLKTKDISPDGINPIIITCITLIIAVLGIVFAWVFMKKKKQKIKK
ncbi:MAG: hypothetical protein E7375_02845 [Clostridiales bacterium]|nr:hypothetical protein [Clostridiales bacterium]